MAKEPVKPQRCAIYTRKSSEEGLEQEFNSLDAQREAGEAYIKSQSHEGWKLIKTAYDDGGFSGGNVERPGLRRLTADIEARKIDIVVVYKVDRLTRSLSDFARLIQVFEQNDVSFVSVTQQFNTTTSMGRLMLNVLLSFAQFEREVTGERIRDKIAASKKKGMWMGGTVPMGYEARDRKLLIKEKDAEVVRHIFRRYLELGNVSSLMHELRAQGTRTRAYTSEAGRAFGGRLFSRGHLYAILNNRLYLGEIVHKGVSHPGEHEAVIDQTLWDEVQKTLASNRHSFKTDLRVESPSFLKGLLQDSVGNRMSPSHGQKRHHRYRYYVSRAILEDRPD
ncbi:MAG: recombinase family protein, partial [Parvibaculum sedimenti]